MEAADRLVEILRGASGPLPGWLGEPGSWARYVSSEREAALLVGGTPGPKGASPWPGKAWGRPSSPTWGKEAYEGLQNLQL